MKRFDALLRILFTLVLALLTATTEAQKTASDRPSKPDSTVSNLQISLLTCSPGKEVWSLYGHTALRLQDPAHGLDVAVNWGLFNYSQPHFIPRFVFGLCDYQIGIEPMKAFLDEYGGEGRGVIEQQLLLTPSEEQAIVRDIAENYLPENRTYRYNFFYDNCTSRARDMIVGHLNGQFVRIGGGETNTSWREMTHQWTENHRWARFGNDLLLGVMSDRSASLVQREFLPDTLRARFDKAIVIRNRQRQPIVGKTTALLIPVDNESNINNGSNSGDESNESSAKIESHVGFWDIFTPVLFFLTFFVLVVIIDIVEWRRRKSFFVVDVILGLISGLAGLILFIMIFSKHPTVQINLQILILNPLSLFLIWPAIRAYRHGRYHVWWQWIYPICFLIFLLGSFVQDYTEGMYFIALALASRCIKPSQNHPFLPFKRTRTISQPSA